jgi:hypothetical protein
VRKAARTCKKKAKKRRGDEGGDISSRVKREEDEQFSAIKFSISVSIT